MRPSFFLQYNDKINIMKETALSRAECLALMEEFGMWENIVRHSLLVEQVAGVLTDILIQAGEDLDAAEVMAGALLHDITKTQSIRTRENHALSGQQLLEKLGYPRIGEIVGCHVMMPMTIFSRKGVSPEEVVHYADKRVLHDAVVSLSERFDDLVVRYGKTQDAVSRLKALEDQTYRIEEKIFARIDIVPEDIAGIVGL
jgi:putative nucleotidyltransferase with HDIG domain